MSKKEREPVKWMDRVDLIIQTAVEKVMRKDITGNQQTAIIQNQIC